MSDEQLDQVESEIAEMASDAFKVAREHHLQQGRELLVSEGETLVKVTPAGERVAVGRIAPPVHYQPGTRIPLR